MSNSSSLKFWTFARTRRFGFALMLGVSIALIAEIVLLKRTGGLLQEGDFPAFYSASILVGESSLESLYGRQQQSEVQNRYWPNEKKEFLAFAYPPYVAQLLRPLSFLSPDNSKLAATGFMLLCFTSALFLLWRYSAETKVSFLFLLGLGLSFAPSFIGIVAGQMVGLLMLLFAAGATFATRERALSQLIAGVFFGAMAVKPQYAGVLAIFFLCQRRWQILLGMALSFGVYYILATLRFGWDWPIHWVQVVRGFVLEDYQVNGFQMVSLAALARMLTGGGLVWLLTLSLVANPLLIYAVLPFLRESKLTKEKVYFLGSCVLLFTPQTLYYDLPLAVLPMLMIGELSTDRRISFAVFILLGSALLLPLRGLGPIEPFSLILFLSFFIGRQKISTGRTSFTPNSL